MTSDAEIKMTSASEIKMTSDAEIATSSASEIKMTSDAEITTSENFANPIGRCGNPVASFSRYLP